MSPDGRKLAFVGPIKGKTSFVIWDLETGKPSVAISSADVEPLWIEWKSNTRLITSNRFFSMRAQFTPTVETRMTAVNVDGSGDLKLIEAGQFDYYVPQIQDRVVSMLPDDEDHILLELPAVARGNARPGAIKIISPLAHPEVVRVNINTARMETITNQRPGVVRWLADAVGNVRIGEESEIDAVGYRIRNLRDDSWRTFHHSQAEKNDSFTPLAFVDGKPDHLYVISNHEDGADGLYEFDLSTDSFVHTIAVLKTGVIAPIVHGQRLVGYATSDTDPPVYLDPDYVHDAALIAKALPDVHCEILERTKDGKHVLVKAFKGNDPVSYWMLSRANGRAELHRLFDTFPSLASEYIAPTRIVSYKARDGLDIPALLTLPPGYANRADPSTLPFVVLPHGGPTARDKQGFDYLVQFLASRGYGVLQPQFRGSTGVNSKFEEAGVRQWGLAMQDDITDGTNWLIEQKLADPKRIAIVGASYGGYAALMGAVKEPTLYRAAIAIAPVTDLPTFVDRLYDFVFWGKSVASIGTDKALLVRTSPARNADKIMIPTLLIHGRKDYTVPVEQTEQMEKALKKADKSAQVLYLDEANHFLSRPDDRIAALKAIEKFLAAKME